MTALILAAQDGNADVIKLLLGAGASIKAKNNVSKRIFICACLFVCVIFLHHSVVLFYSSILLLWYVGYDNFISMSNVFVFIFIIIIFFLVLLLANMKINILEKSLFSISHEFLYFSLFLHFIYFWISSICIFLINFCFLFFSLLVSSFCL